MAMQIPGGPTIYGGGAAQLFQLPGGGAGTSSSFGAAADARFNAASFVDSPRCRELRYRRSFHDCTQHDFKMFDFDGNVIQPGPSFQHAGRMVSNAPPAMFVPWPNRRPVAPVRLTKTIVKRYTNLVFGNGRFPSVKVAGDPKSQDFAEALAKAEKLHGVMRQGRTIGGSVGTVGWSWRYYEGKPRVEAHDGCNLHVHTWADRGLRIPSHVTECYLIEEWEVNPKTNRRELVPYWMRRDWTEDADVVFRMAKVTQEEPQWIVDEKQSVEHGDGFCHFVWTANIPGTKANDYDGDCDYADVEEQSVALDILNSIVVRGGIKNLDPTLTLKMKPSQFDRGIRKGSDNALLLGEGGAASYLESGASITAGLALIDAQRKHVLEAAECVIPDPDELTAAGMSSVAIAALYSPMISAADVLRQSYGDAIEQLLVQQIKSYRRRLSTRTTSKDEAGNEVETIEGEFETDEAGNDVLIEHTLDLPPRVIEEEEIGEDGKPTGAMTMRIEARELGESAESMLELEWPPYFAPSDADKQQKATSLTMANGGKPLVSHRTSVEQFTAGTSIDPVTEWQRLIEQQSAAARKESGMFPDAGMPVDPTEPVEVEADAAMPTEPVAQPEISLTPTSQAQMITVDEARASAKLPPHTDPKIGAMNFAAYVASLEKTQPAQPEQPDDIESVMLVNEMRSRAVPPLPPLPEPDGSMTVTEFKAARAARGTAAGQAVGTAEGQLQAEALVPSAPEPAPEPPGAPIPADPPVDAPEGQPGAPPGPAEPPGGEPPKPAGFGG